MSLKKSIKRICIDYDLTIAEIAESVKMSEGGFRKSINDNKLAFDKVEKIAFFLNKNTSWLIALGESK